MHQWYLNLSWVIALVIVLLEYRFTVTEYVSKFHLRSLVAGAALYSTTWRAWTHLSGDIGSQLCNSLCKKSPPPLHPGALAAPAPSVPSCAGSLVPELRATGPN